jgi:hypothetical protein
MVLSRRQDGDPQQPWRQKELVLEFRKGADRDEPIPIAPPTSPIANGRLVTPIHRFFEAMAGSFVHPTPLPTIA